MGDSAPIESGVEGRPVYPDTTQRGGRRVTSAPGDRGAAARVRSLRGLGPDRSARSRRARPSSRPQRRRARRALARTPRDPTSAMLFGDLHVHTTYSIDAFLYGLPLFGGEGAHPPADACDFARYCSELDFFSLNDHAEGLTPSRWRESIESLRDCNARAGDPADPDLVAYVGWEWTQTGTTPDDALRAQERDLPGTRRRGAAHAPDLRAGRRRDEARALPVARARRRSRALRHRPALRRLPLVDRASSPACRSASPVSTCAHSRADCQESAADPAVLFEKLAQWGYASLVIPHGLTWGIHAPPGATLARAAHARAPRSRAPAPARGVLGPRRDRALRRGRRARRRRRAARRVQRAHRRFPAVLLAGRRDREARAARIPTPMRVASASRRRAGSRSRRAATRTGCCRTRRSRSGSIATRCRGEFKSALSPAPVRERAGRARARERERARRERRTAALPLRPDRRRATRIARARAAATSSSGARA